MEKCGKDNLYIYIFLPTVIYLYSLRLDVFFGGIKTIRISESSSYGGSQCCRKYVNEIWPDLPRRCALRKTIASKE